MTKEALKQEAEEKAKKRTKGFKCQENCEKSYVMGALDFAEPREKQIEELNKENAILEGKLADLQSEYIELENFHHNEINELNEQNIKDCENFNKTMKEIKEQWNKEHYQLIKAKELLNDFLLMAKVEHLKERYETVSEAEQFLKESE